MRRGRTARSLGLGVGGVVAIGCAVALGLTGGSAHTPPKRAQRAAATAPAATIASPSPAPPAEVPFMAGGTTAIARPGHPDRIVIRSIGLDAKVVDVGATVQDGKAVWETAAFAVGFYRNTAMPGQPGNAVLAGHISSPVSHKGDIFRHLPSVRIGDQVDVYLATDGPGGDTKVSYVISQLNVVQPDATQVMGPTSDATLTLLTCYPDNVYTHRLVVVGKLLKPPA